MVNFIQYWFIKLPTPLSLNISHSNFYEGERFVSHLYLIVEFILSVVRRNSSKSSFAFFVRSRFSSWNGVSIFYNYFLPVEWQSKDKLSTVLTIVIFWTLLYTLIFFYCKHPWINLRFMWWCINKNWFDFRFGCDKSETFTQNNTLKWPTQNWKSNTKYYRKLQRQQIFISTIFDIIGFFLLLISLPN